MVYCLNRHEALDGEVSNNILFLKGSVQYWYAATWSWNLFLIPELVLYAFLTNSFGIGDESRNLDSCITDLNENQVLLPISMFYNF